VIENITCIAPHDIADLSCFLNTVIVHGLVRNEHREAIRYLSRVAARPVWAWSEARHQGVLDNLQEATGVAVTLNGPMHLGSGIVLDSIGGRATRRIEGAAPNRRIARTRRGGTSGGRALDPDKFFESSTQQVATDTFGKSPYSIQFSSSYHVVSHR
jgi:hypothetical protein